MFYCKFNETFQKSYSVEHLWMDTSEFCLLNKSAYGS